MTFKSWKEQALTGISSSPSTVTQICERNCNLNVRYGSYLSVKRHCVSWLTSSLPKWLYSTHFNYFNSFYVSSISTGFISWARVSGLAWQSFQFWCHDKCVTNKINQCFFLFFFWKIKGFKCQCHSNEIKLALEANFTC